MWSRLTFDIWRPFPGRIGQLLRDSVSRYRRLMSAVTTLNKQIEGYRQMTGEQRLMLAWELHELSCDVAREAICQSASAPRVCPRGTNERFSWNAYF